MLVPLVGHHNGSDQDPSEGMNEPDRAPKNSIPTPALLPTAIAFWLKHRRRVG